MFIAGLADQSYQEFMIIAAVRSGCELLMNQLDIDELLKRLDLLPSGVMVLRVRREWSLETAFRVAVKLGFDMKITMSIMSHENKDG